MKFYDNAGNKHNTIVGAYLFDAQRKVDNTIRANVPGYDAVTNKYREIKNEIVGKGKIQMATMYGEFIHHDKPIDECDQQTDTIENYQVAADEEYDDDSQNTDNISDADCETPSNKIFINYAMKRMELYDEGGKLIASSPIEDVLLRSISNAITLANDVSVISQDKMPKVTIITPDVDEDEIEG